MEKTADFRALTFGVGQRFQKGRVPKLVPDVGIGKAADTVLVRLTGPERVDGLLVRRD